MQTKLAAFGLIAAVGGGAWLVTGSGSGDYYAMSPQEAASRLATARMPGQVTDTMSGSGDLEHHVYKRGIDEVVWEFSLARAPIATFTAALEPDGEGTRVSVDFAIADNEMGKAAKADFAEGQEFLTGALELAMGQHIAATLDERGFDDAEFAKRMAKYALTNPLQARRFFGKMQELDNGGGMPATKAAIQQRIIDEAAWNGEIDADVADAYEAEDSDFAAE